MNPRTTRLLVALLVVAGCSSPNDPTRDAASTPRPDATAEPDARHPLDVAQPDAPSAMDGAPTLDITPAPDAPAPPDAAPTEMRTSVSQFGITWTFDRPSAVGRFVNGDWFVVGPVTIASVSPAPTADRNGSVVNPRVGRQGYDSRGGEYDATVRARFPLTLMPTASLVSSISHGASTCTDGSTPGYRTYDGDCQRGPVDTQAVLTVLAAPPPADAFRPPYINSDFKPLYLASRIDWSRLPRLPRPASAPTDAVALRHVERPWIDHQGNWTLQHSCATNNMYCYGREIGSVVADLALYVLLDTPAQRTLAVRLVQLGIDNYGIVHGGNRWSADGGHMNGRKWPVVFAGVMLGDAAIRSPGPISGEDQQTYAGEGGRGLWGAACTNCYMASGCMYTASCPNGRRDCRDPAGRVDGCDDYRNCCTSATWVGQALSAMLLRARSDWSHEPFFNYVDRWMTGDVPGGRGTSSSFVAAMWTAHRASMP